jgi:hypothetical protein
MDADWPYDVTAAGAPDPAAVRRLQKLAYWLDDRFSLPGTKMRVGLDGLLGLIPGIGDAAGAAISAYIIAEAYRLGVPPSQLVRMGINLGIDALVGSIPVLGDIFDVGWKANRKNVALVLRHLESRSGATFGPAARAAPRRSV